MRRGAASHLNDRRRLLAHPSMRLAEQLDDDQVEKRRHPKGDHCHVARGEGEQRRSELGTGDACAQKDKRWRHDRDDADRRWLLAERRRVPVAHAM